MFVLNCRNNWLLIAIAISFDEIREGNSWISIGNYWQFDDIC